MASILDSYISSGEVCQICDKIEKHPDQFKFDADIRNVVANSLVLMEKEQIRYALIFDYELQHSFPAVLELTEREQLIDSYISAGKHDGYDTLSDLADKLIEEPLRVVKWVESVVNDLFDDERHFGDPFAFENDMIVEAAYEE